MVHSSRCGLVLWLLALCLSGCEDGARQTTSTGGRATTEVTLPDGTVITAELAVTREEQQMGLMFRSELAEDRGMLFLFNDEYPRPFWMFQTMIPLDIIWLDANKEVVEVAPHVPPCKSVSEGDCPNYGGALPSRYVLELAAGEAEKHGVQPGTRIEF